MNVAPAACSRNRHVVLGLADRPVVDEHDDLAGVDPRVFRQLGELLQEPDAEVGFLAAAARSRAAGE